MVFGWVVLVTGIALTAWGILSLKNRTMSAAWRKWLGTPKKAVEI
jgi:hypothetical protein